MSNEVATQEAGPKALIQSGIKPAALVPNTLDGVWRVANLLTTSRMVPYGMDTTEKVSVALMHGLEVGLTPMQAIQSIAIVNGRPTIWGDAALALCRASGLMESFSETFVGEGDAMEAICTVERKGEKKAIIGRFSVADAKTSGLWDKKGRDGQKTPWQLYPKRMLQLRARGFALRDAFTDVLKGLAIKEEAEDVAATSQPETLVKTGPRAAPPPPVEDAEFREIKDTPRAAPQPNVVSPEANAGEDGNVLRDSSPASQSDEGALDITAMEKVVDEFVSRAGAAANDGMLDEAMEDVQPFLSDMPQELRVTVQNAYEDASERFAKAEAAREAERVKKHEEAEKRKAARKAKQQEPAEGTAESAGGDVAEKQADPSPPAAQKAAPPPPADDDGDFPGDKPSAASPDAPQPSAASPTPHELDMALAAQRDPEAIIRELARQKAKKGTAAFNRWYKTISEEDTKIVDAMPDMEEQIAIAEAADKAAG